VGASLPQPDPLIAVRGSQIIGRLRPTSTSLPERGDDKAASSNAHCAARCLSAWLGARTQRAWLPWLSRPSRSPD